MLEFLGPFLPQRRTRFRRVRLAVDACAEGPRDCGSNTAEDTTNA